MTTCNECGGEVDADNLTDDLCAECYGAEELTCDECGCSYQRMDSPSESTCWDCL